MPRRQEAGDDAVREDVRGALCRQMTVESLQVGQATAKDDDIRIEQVDDAGQGTAEARLVALQGGFAVGIAGRRAGSDGRGIERRAAVGAMVGGPGRGGRFSRR